MLVACSGGADSLALAAASAEAGRHLARSVGAVVVDHGLLDGSDAVAQRAAAQCRDLGLSPVTVQRVDVPTSGGGGPESRARSARYQALDEARVAAGADGVLLGHTLDDQAETVLLGLARGSGIRSIASMPPVRGVWHRPLLGISRAQTARACESLGIEYWDDPTNSGGSGDPLRSRLRAVVMPRLAEILGPDIARSLARTGELAAQDADFIEASAAELVLAAEQAVRECGCERDLTGARLNASTLADAHPALATRAVRIASISQGSPAGALTYAHCAEVLRLATQWRGQGPISLPGGIEAARHCGTLEIYASAQASTRTPGGTFRVQQPT